MEALDTPLFQTLNSLPAFPFALLVRPDRKSVRMAYEDFLTKKKSPTFTFRRADAFDCTAYTRELAAVEDRIHSIPCSIDIQNLYQEKITELRNRCTLINAIQKRDDEMVSLAADRLFGSPTQSTEDLQNEFNELVTKTSAIHSHHEVVDAIQFQTMVERALKYYGMSDWIVRPTTRSSISLIHASKHRNPIIKIPRKLLISRARAARLLTHEIETHALRTHNGINSPILLLGRGLAGYLQTEEGLAIALQQRLRDEDSIDPGFWDAWVASLTQTYSFRETFETILTAQTKLHDALDRANVQERAKMATWNLLLRAMRGIHQPDRPGLGYRRDHMYRSGLIQVREALKMQGDAILPTLFAGHAGLHHISLLQSLGIIGKTPDMIGKNIVSTIRKEQKNTRN